MAIIVDEKNSSRCKAGIKVDKLMLRGLIPVSVKPQEGDL
jgi:hypothetical protein